MKAEADFINTSSSLVYHIILNTFFSIILDSVLLLHAKNTSKHTIHLESLWGGQVWGDVLFKQVGLKELNWVKFIQRQLLSLCHKMVFLAADNMFQMSFKYEFIWKTTSEFEPPWTMCGLSVSVQTRQMQRQKNTPINMLTSSEQLTRLSNQIFLNCTVYIITKWHYIWAMSCISA